MKGPFGMTYFQGLVLLVLGMVMEEIGKSLTQKRLVGMGG